MLGRRFCCGALANAALLMGALASPAAAAAWTPRAAAVSVSATGAMTDLGTIGGTNSFGNVINAQGQVAGTASTAGGANHAFRWTASGGMQDLGSLGGTNSVGTAINAQAR